MTSEIGLIRSDTGNWLVMETRKLFQEQFHYGKTPLRQSKHVRLSYILTPLYAVCNATCTVNVHIKTRGLQQYLANGEPVLSAPGQYFSVIRYIT